MYIPMEQKEDITWRLQLASSLDRRDEPLGLANGCSRRPL